MRWSWSYAVWGWLLFQFLVFEVSGNWRWGPWVTLSETVEHLETIWFPIKVFCFALLIMLVAHWVFRGGFLRSSALGLVVALAAHFVNKHWP